MEQRLVPGVEVEHAGRRWRVHVPLGPDAVLLRNDAGEIVSAVPTRIGFPADEDVGRPAMRVLDERNFSDTQWAEAARRRDLIAALAGRSACRRADVDAVAKELGIKRRRVWTLLRQAAVSDCDIAAFLPRRGTRTAKRLSAGVETVIAQAIDQHYAQPNRPSVARLHREITERCKIAGAQLPSYRAVAARVRDRDQAWLVHRREGPKAARALRLLTGAHPGAGAPWERVQTDSTPCDIRLVRETDRTVIGRPTVTFAIDLYSRVVLGFSVSLEAASTVTVAACLVHACLPKDDWLARRDLTGIHWPVYGRPGTLEYDRGPENVARGIQRGLRRYGIAAEVRAVGQPGERRLHLDTLSGFLSNSATTSIVQRERSLRASAPNGWFGQPMRAEHAAPLRMLSMGVMFDRLAKTAALRQRRARIRSLGGDQPPSDPTTGPDQPAATR